MRCTQTKLLRLPCAARALGLSALLACSADPGLATRHDGDARERTEDADASHSDLNDAAPLVESGSDAERASNERAADASAADATEPYDASTVAADARTLLITPALWLPVGLFDDPFDDRPEFPRCPAAALMAEILSDEPVFSVNTGDCDYVTVSQPSQREIAAGETIKVRLWHFELSADEPAEAHAVVLVAGLPVLDERVPIPQPGGLISRALRLTRAIPAGAPIYFHLHNHGANSWSLVELSAGP